MIDRAPWATAEQMLTSAVEGHIFPAVAATVGSSRGPLWHFTAGTLAFDADAPPTVPHTLFDLASLTKPLATTSVVLQLVESKRLSLSEPISTCLPEWRGGVREAVTVADLLEHAGGLSARLLDPPPLGRRSFEHDICAMPLEYAPRSRSLYTDLGFILLGFIAEDRGAASLATQTQALIDSAVEYAPASDAALLLASVPPQLRHSAAPTLPLPEDTRRGRRLVGDVHDNYAAALGGFAGHAGLFGTASGVGHLARLLLVAARGDEGVGAPLSAAVMRRALTRTRVTGSSRALGWDTMLPTSSCGSRLSATAFGHVGFTGTSLWIDPELDRYFVLLTNRVCEGGTSDDMQAVRRAFHDTLAAT